MGVGFKVEGFWQGRTENRPEIAIIITISVSIDSVLTRKNDRDDDKPIASVLAASSSIRDISYTWLEKTKYNHSIYRKTYNTKQTLFTS